MNAILFFIACVFSGTLLPVPEDATLLAAGVSIVDLRSFLMLWVAGVAGLFLRDGGFFMLGKGMGEGLFRVPWVVRIFGRERIDASRKRIESWGSRAIVGARMAFGMRSVAFLAAGALGVPVRTFVFWDLIALAVWLPIALLLGAMMREPVLAGMAWVSDHPVLVASLAGIVLVSYITSEMSRHNSVETKLQPLG